MNTQSGIIVPFIQAVHPLYLLWIVGGTLGYMTLERRLNLPAVPWTGIFGSLIALEVALRVW